MTYYIIFIIHYYKFDENEILMNICEISGSFSADILLGIELLSSYTMLHLENYFAT